jgi:hypothetical protein
VIGERKDTGCLACARDCEKNHRPRRKLIHYRSPACCGPLYLCPFCDEGPILQIEQRRARA